MEFIKVAFTITQAEAYQIDLLIDALGEIGYDTFNETEAGFDAYIQANEFSDDLLNTVVGALDENVICTHNAIAVVSENWNKEWEKNFSPLIVNDDCYVRATFHAAKPAYRYEIVIDPKMAFGTGHHETTTMMMQYILSADIEGKELLDMGCGTGILAILCAKRGAKAITAIDNDPVCFQSTIENSALNGVANIIALCGGKEAIPDTKFEVILANINRNILLDQIPGYSNVLASGGRIFFSGFYETPDLDMIREMCLKYNISFLDHKKTGDWVAAQFIKN